MRPDRRTRPAARPATALPAAAILAAVAVLATACAGAAGGSVAIIGDSITSLDAQDAQRQLGDRFDVEVSATFGATVAEMLPAATSIASRDHDQVIINLGTNDVLRGIPTGTSMDALRRMIGLFPSARCIHLTNVNTHMVDRDGAPANRAEAEAFDAALDELARSDPRLSVVDWDAAVGRSIADGGAPLTKDSVHPTTEGNAVLNSLYRAALEACPD